VGQIVPLDADTLLCELVGEALDRGATDVHLSPEGRSVRVAFRVDGLVHPEQSVLAARDYELLVGRLKVLSDLNIAERRRPQAGGVVLPVAGGTVEIRASFLPTIEGESTALRLLTSSRAPLPLDELGLPRPMRERLVRLASRPSGLLLVVGPTGSGKTTTLYALAQEQVRAVRRVITVEEPVERRLPGATQVAVSRAEGVDFAQALRAVLRHDPDVIMVGEMRDAETARIALSASLSGHLVLASMHADGPRSALERLAQLEIDRSRLVSVLAGILAQRLVRVRCPRCSGALCPRCRGTGFAGRTGLFGLFEPDQETRRHLVAGPVDPIDPALDGSLLARHGLERVAAGETTHGELARVMGLDTDLEGSGEPHRTDGQTGEEACAA
jgi:type II secretory ATPase GspE/PulE/Tfp pilus assembly ATPase PilB-like protein